MVNKDVYNSVMHDMHATPALAQGGMARRSYIFRSVYQIDMKFDRQLRQATETSWDGLEWC